MKLLARRLIRTTSLSVCFGLLAPVFGQNKNPQNPREFFGPAFPTTQRSGFRSCPPPPSASSGNPVVRWNQIAIDASGLDHTPLATGETRVYGEQLGPCRSSRAIAIVEVAVFEAVNAIKGRYQSNLGLARAANNTSQAAAVAQAARDALAAMFPSQTARFDGFLAEDLAQIPNGTAKTQGIALGKTAAAASVADRARDGSAYVELRVGVDYFPKTTVGKWEQDPISQSPVALGVPWGRVTPFVMTSGDQFRLPAPPALDSLEHSLAYVEVKRLGGDGVTTPTERTAEETEIGIFWAYDGTPSLCAPPRLYNQVARVVAERMRTPEDELALLLALVNVAMADAAIASWDTKWHYEVARPVTLIRRSAEDGNNDTVANATFKPLGAPASNLAGPNFTPPFPSYPSGHATFGGALFQTLRRFYRTDDIPFRFVSDEYNGITQDNTGAVRPLVTRTFQNLTEAETENARSRIYLGIHWSYDATDGVEQGRKVGNYVFDHLYLR